MPAAAVRARVYPRAASARELTPRVQLAEEPELLRRRRRGGGHALCREVIILTQHEKRRFSRTVDFITSPGWLTGGDSRRKAGLLFGGVARVVTTLGLFGFDPTTRRMRIEAVHPGVTVEQVRDETSFELGAAERVATTTPPSPEELGLLRELDPRRQFTG